MIIKPTEFITRIHPHVKACGKCHGVGKLVVEKEYGESEYCTCEACNGTGRIIESRETVVKQRPFRPGKDDDGAVLSV